jgi:hypothetical protein
MLVLTYVSYITRILSHPGCHSITETKLESFNLPLLVIDDYKDTKK